MSEDGTYFLTKEDVIELHAGLVERFGGVAGVRDDGLLEAALAQPPMEIFGEVVHPTIYDQAAAYLFHLVQNHSFHDGNKRIGLHACLAFLESNGVTVSKEQEPWYEFTLSLASGKQTKQDCGNFVREHSV
jgi:death-on-curing protein